MEDFRFTVERWRFGLEGSRIGNWHPSVEVVKESGFMNQAGVRSIFFFAWKVLEIDCEAYFLPSKTAFQRS